MTCAAATSLSDLLGLIIRARGVQSASELAVLLSLVFHVDWDTARDAWPSIEVIAAESRVSRSTVKRVLARLLREHYIIVQAPPSPRRPATYALNLRRLAMVQVPLAQGVHGEPSAHSDRGERRDTQGVHGEPQGVHGEPQGVHGDLSRGFTMNPDPVLEPVLNISSAREPREHAQVALRQGVHDDPRGHGEPPDATPRKIKIGLAEGSRKPSAAYVLGRLGMSDVRAGETSDSELWRLMHRKAHHSYPTADAWFLAVRGYQIDRRRRAAAAGGTGG
jgi:hypothetical protein